MELFINVRNVKQKIKLFFKLKLEPNCFSIEWGSLLRTHQALAVDEPAAGRRQSGQAPGRQGPNPVLGHEASAAADAPGAGLQHRARRRRRGQRGGRSRPRAQSPGAGPVQSAKCARRVSRGRRLRRGRGIGGGHG